MKGALSVCLFECLHYDWRTLLILCRCSSSCCHFWEGKWSFDAAASASKQSHDPSSQLLLSISLCMVIVAVRSNCGRLSCFSIHLARLNLSSHARKPRHNPIHFICETCYAIPVAFSAMVRQRQTTRSFDWKWECTKKEYSSVSMISLMMSMIVNGALWWLESWMKAKNIHFLLLYKEERLMSTYHEGGERKCFV